MMPVTLPVKTIARTWTRVPYAAHWLLLLAGVLVALGFPNDVLPGRAGDHPVWLLSWAGTLLLLGAVWTLEGKAQRLGTWLFAGVWYLITLSWMRLFGVIPWVLLALYLSLTPLVTMLVVQRCVPHLPRWALPLAVAVLWTALEWLRGQGMFGLAWAELGASQIDGPLAPLAGIGGVPLLTFVMLWTSGTLVMALRDRTQPRRVLVTALGVVLALAAVGQWQTSGALARWHNNRQHLDMTLVQPSSLIGLSPETLTHPVTPEEFERRMQRLVTLSLQATPPEDTAARALRRFGRIRPQAATLMIWPESALPDIPSDPRLLDLCRRTQSALLVGAPSYRLLPDGEYRVRNSAYLLGVNGIEQARYDKIRLVPFGEFVPCRPFVARYFPVRRYDLQPGTAWRTITYEQQRIGMGICFESTVTAIARRYADQQAHYLIYITNDAWFHRTAALRQHLNHARFRALETGLPVARAASTGISSFIAPDGRPFNEIGVNRKASTRTVLHAGVPGTLYTRGGWCFGPTCLAGAVLLLALLLRRRDSQRTTTSP